MVKFWIIKLICIVKINLTVSRGFFNVARKYEITHMIRICAWHLILIGQH